jgi:HNH endonuclease
MPAAPIKPPPSINRLRELFSYDSETGLFTRRFALRQYPAGIVAGSKRNNGYVALTIDRRVYQLHRLAWFWVHGSCPDQLDHINQIRDDNRIANLRLATPEASIMVNGKNVTLGYFKEKERAAGVRAAALEIVEQPAFQAEMARRLKAAEEYHAAA